MIWKKPSEKGPRFNRDVPLDFDLRSDGVALTGNANSKSELNTFLERLEVIATVLPNANGECDASAKPTARLA